MKSSSHLGIVSGVVLSLVATIAHSNAQVCDPIEVAELSASDGDRHDAFGESLALSGDTAIVGSIYHDLHRNFGAAWIYRFDGAQWIEEAELFEPGVDDGDRYGETVAISGDFAFVGRPGGPGNESRSGAVHVYHFTGTEWTHEGQLFPPDGQEGDSFGMSIHAWEGLFVVGADGDDDNGRDSGSAYVFRYDGAAWVQETKLLPNASAAGDRFGSAVTVADNRIVIGAPRNRDQGDNAGTAYVFAYDGQKWTEEAKLLAPHGRDFEQFGDDVAISDRTIVIGAENSGSSGSNSGSAYVFHHNGDSWRPHTHLRPPAGSLDHRFGSSTAVAGATILIGATGAEGRESASGAAYVFRLRDGANWVQEAKLMASDGEENDRFGHAVALSGNTAIMTAPNHDDAIRNIEGSAYVFDLNCPQPGCLTLNVENLIAGKRAIFNITNGKPNARAITTFGFEPGQTKIQDVAGYCATFGIQGISQNKIIGGTRNRFDANGAIQFHVTIPANLAGLEILFQSAQQNTCPDECTSNLIETTIQ